MDIRTMPRALIYDIETLSPVMMKDTVPVHGINYASGFNDYQGLGIACLCAYLTDLDCYRVFDVYNMQEFAKLIPNYEFLVGFNNHKFDNNLLLHFKIATQAQIFVKSYDILRDVYCGLELHPDGPYFNKKYKGNKLDNLAELNLGRRKTLDGQLAPILWQQGKVGQVIDYCLEDVRLTRLLFEKVIYHQKLLTVHGEVDMRGPSINSQKKETPDWG